MGSDATATLVGNHPEAAAAIATGPEIAPDKTLRMEIFLKLHDRATLDRLIVAQQDRTSPQYHQWLTRDEFNSRFGPTQSDVAAVSSWLTSQGFTVESADPSQHRVVFTGAATNAEAAFGVKIHTDATGEHYSNLNDPVIPKSLAPIVAAVLGLSNLAHARPAVELSPDFSQVPDVKLGKKTHFGPNDLYTFYDQTPPTSSANDGTGTDCIALIEDSNFDDGSVNAFDSAFGLGAPDLSTAIVDGSDPGESGDYLETLLDVEYAHAAAPGAPIEVYIGNNATSSPSGAIFDAAARAVSDNRCGAISISFAFCGLPSSAFSEVIDPLAAQAASQKQAIFVAAGDWGAAGLAPNKKQTGCKPANSHNINELAANPNVTAVGGTQFTPDYKSGNDVGDVAESVWRDAKGAGGGGESTVFSKPSYQSGLIPNDTMRDIPDVSLVASPVHPGFFFGQQGKIFCCIGGTSLSTPYWAGIATLAAQKANETRLGPLNPTLYSIAGYRDVTKGTNTFHGVSGFKATAGYDRSSGLGTPDIDSLVSAIAGQ
ncbi:MAG: S53 family peptidase [Candidatus Binataceae bacterium]